MVLHQSIGILRYSGINRLVVEVDSDIAAFHRSLIPKSIRVQPPMYPPHVTVVREHKESLADRTYWGVHDGEDVEFSYSSVVHMDETYCWLNVFCVRLEEIRRELGLPVTSPYTLPPSGFEKCFHMTIGNFKNS